MNYTNFPSIDSYKHGTKIYIGLRINEEYETEIDLSSYVTNFVQFINFQWNTDNSFRNAQDIDFYVQIVDKSDFDFGQVVEEESQMDISYQEEKEESQEIVEPKNEEELLDDLLD